MTIGIYCIRNIVNDKRYIGSSGDIEQRWNSHRHELRTNTHHSIHLQRAWNKHGEDCFEFSILKITTIEELISSEQELIDLNKSHDMNHGYNMSPTAGSCRGYKHTEEFKKKCSERVIERYRDPNERTKTGTASANSWTQEMRDAKSKLMKEIWADPETKKERSELTSAGASRPDRVEKRSKRMKEKWKSTEDRQKAALASPNRKRIQHIETGMIYESISEACTSLPVSKQTIKNNLQGKFKSAKGMNFKYVD